MAPGPEISLESEAKMARGGPEKEQSNPKPNDTNGTYGCKGGNPLHERKRDGKQGAADLLRMLESRFTTASCSGRSSPQPTYEVGKGFLLEKNKNTSGGARSLRRA